MQKEEMSFEEALVELRSSSMLVRAQAASRLADLGNVEAVEPLVAMLQEGTFESDEEVLLAEMIVLGLAKLRDPRAVPAIARHLMDSPYLETEELACDALEMIGGKEAEEWLRKKFLQPECEIRELVGSAIYSVEGDRCAPFFLEQLRSTDPTTLRIAAEVLGEIGYEPAILHLQRVVMNPDAAVREAAAESLEMLLGPEVRELVRSSGA